ncbi:hypothetical protein J7438_15425 [Thalassotalea sp. G20_0]|uniref:hypothetical protein n=1 Tax=Thalassotalea sp. G20_0 TaxID=2821093 RepID=UPI001ADA7499|nr:hypothetical protein [Thalassotalea sp. G20_0]MBO9495469.1 hypothetical protein [Thalassotalea sp. G20_0]
MESAALQQQMGESLIRASNAAFGIESPDGHVYTADDKQAALGRHTVKKLNISTSYLAGMAAKGGISGALGGIAGVTYVGLTRTIGEFSWKPVAIAAAAGATLNVLRAIANARPMTPLEHASQELEQAMEDEAYLVNHPLDQPDHEYSSNDFLVIKYMTNRYQDSWKSLWLLWAGIHPPYHQSNLNKSMNEFSTVLESEYGVKKEDISNVVGSMGDIDSPEAATELPDFKRLMTKFPVPAKDQEDLARLMFIFNRIIKESLDKTRSHPVTELTELYQDLLKTRYCQYRERLEQDKIRLQEDICILRGLERNHPAPVSGPSAAGAAES